MTTPYAASVNIGSVSYNGYVNAPITGPLSTNQTAFHMPYHSYGTLNGIRPTPPQFYPSQEPINTEMNTNMRQQYLRATAIGPKSLAKQIEISKFSPPLGYQINSSGRMISTSSHMNYIAPISGDSYINILKSKAIGKSAYKVGLPTNALISTKNYYPSGTRHVIKRVRSGGCVAPKKKGAIENIHLSNGNTCGWGSIARQTY